jgi:DNA repair ATPase RecN
MELKEIELLPFTDEELEKLNLTKEELDILEYASAYSQTVDMIPEDLDAFSNKIEETFGSGDDPMASIQKLTDLCETDPEFVNQMIAMQEVFSAVKPYPMEEISETEK